MPIPGWRFSCQRLDQANAVDDVVVIQAGELHAGRLVLAMIARQTGLPSAL
jgi:hypothetical protein